MSIFLFGLAGTGKDTVADIFREDYHYESLALADPIREEYARFIGSRDYKQNRPKMIEIGEAYKQIYGQDVWCNETLRIAGDMPFLTLEEHGILIRDGRYQHEYNFFVRQYGYTPIHLVSDTEVRLERLRKRDGTTQMSSLMFEKKNFINDHPEALVLENNGTLSELRDNIRRLLGK